MNTEQQSSSSLLFELCNLGLMAHSPAGKWGSSCGTISGSVSDLKKHTSGTKIKINTKEIVPIQSQGMEIAFLPNNAENTQAMVNFSQHSGLHTVICMSGQEAEPPFQMASLNQTKPS